MRLHDDGARASSEGVESKCVVAGCAWPADLRFAPKLLMWMVHSVICIINFSDAILGGMCPALPRRVLPLCLL
jgi:hypothetical protein